MKWTSEQRQTHIQNWQQSSLTKRQYSTQHQIGYSTFCKWIQSTNAEEPKAQAASKFIVLPQPYGQPGELNIKLPNGIQISCQGWLTESLFELLQNA